MGSLPYNIRVNVNVPFPALVAGASGIKITKQSGIWTVAVDYTVYYQNASVSDPVNSYTLVWNSVSGLFTLVQISAIPNLKVVKTLTGSSYAALPADDTLLVNAVPFTVNVDWSIRAKPLRIVDITGNASVATPVTVTPAAGQTQLASVNYSYIIDGAGGSITLTPLPNGTGAY